MSNRRRVYRALALEPLDKRTLLTCVTGEVCDCYGGEVCDSESYGGEAYIGDCDEYGGDAYGGECELVTETAQIVEQITMMNSGTDAQGNNVWIVTLQIVDGYDAEELQVRLGGAFENETIDQRIDDTGVIRLQISAPPTLYGEALFIVTGPNSSGQDSTDFVYMIL